MQKNLVFFKTLLDSLDNQIAVIDRRGFIVYVNRVWMEFGIANGMPSNFDWIGKNYTNVCNLEENDFNASIFEAAKGIRQVLSGLADVFESDYPCHSPQERRWFMMRIAAMKSSEKKLWVISHTNITARKIAEEAVEKLSVTDPLTGLANRRRLNKFLKDEWHRAQRSRMPLSVIVFDIDHFKMVNDTLGHASGDECLIKVSKILSQFAQRPGDLAARLGGEEFVLILGSTSAENAFRLADAIRVAVMKLNIYLPDGKLITISAGLTSLIPAEKGGEMNLIKIADKALYSAKRNGRNRVEIAGC